MENSIPKDIIKNNGDLGGEQSGGASASRAAKFNRTLQGAKKSPPGSTVNLGLKKLCACAGSYPFTKISAECGTDLKAFPNTCRPINTGQKLCWRKKLGQTLTNKLL